MPILVSQPQISCQPMPFRPSAGSVCDDDARFELLREAFAFDQGDRLEVLPLTPDRGSALAPRPPVAGQWGQRHPATRRQVWAVTAVVHILGTALSAGIVQPIFPRWGLFLGIAHGVGALVNARAALIPEEGSALASEASGATNSFVKKRA